MSKSKFFNKIPQVFLTFASLVAIAGINYTVIHSPLVLLFVLIMFAHELGHYFIAKMHDGSPRLPIFLPIPFLLVAITKTTKLNKKGIKNTALHGPVVGFLSTLLIFLYNIMFGFMSSTPLIFMMLNESLLNIIGSDGAKYRKANRSLAQ